MVRVIIEGLTAVRVLLDNLANPFCSTETCQRSPDKPLSDPRVFFYVHPQRYGLEQDLVTSRWRDSM